MFLHCYLGFIAFVLVKETGKASRSHLFLLYKDKFGFWFIFGVSVCVMMNISSNSFTIYYVGLIYNILILYG